MQPAAESVAGLCLGPDRRVVAPVPQLHPQSLLLQAAAKDAALYQLIGMYTPSDGITLSAPQDVLLSGMVILHLEPMV